MLIPSVIACLLYEPYREVVFVGAFDYNPYIGVSKTFGVVFGDWKYVWPAILVSITQIVAVAIIMSAMDTHFRTGRLTLRHPWRLINYSVFPIALGFVLMGLISIALRFLLFGLVMLVQVICRSIGLPSGVALALIAAVAFALFVLHVLIITPMLFWAPIMFVYGYRFRDAAATSFKLISGKKVFPSLLIPMIVCAGIQLLVRLIGAPYAVACVVSFFVFLVTNVYVTVAIMIAFYDISGLERRDIKPYQAVPLPVPKKPEPTPDNNKDKDNAPEKTDDTVEKQPKKSSGKKKSSDRPEPVKESDVENKPKKQSKSKKRTTKTVDQSEQPEAEVNNGI